MIYYNLGLLNQAEEDYRLSVALRHDSYFAHYLLGGVYLDKGMWQQAITEQQLALKYNPEFAPSYYELGLIYHRLGRRQESASALENFLNLGEGTSDQIGDARKLLRELKTE